MQIECFNKKMVYLFEYYKFLMHEIEFKSGSHNLRETFLSVKECQSIPHAKSKDLIPQIIDNSDYHESDKHVFQIDFKAITLRFI